MFQHVHVEKHHSPHNFTLAYMQHPFQDFTQDGQTPSDKFKRGGGGHNANPRGEDSTLKVKNITAVWGGAN